MFPRAAAFTLVLVALLGCLLAALAGPARAARPDPLIQFPSDGLRGTTAGRFQVPNAVGVSPLTGNVYVAEVGNARIQEFTAWGQFVRAFGWNVNASSPEEKFQICTSLTGCKKGTPGDGDGQFGDNNFQAAKGGIAVDPAGSVYVGDFYNHRVQKFNPAGEFLFAFGSEGTGDGQFSTTSAYQSYIAVSPDGSSVYVGDRDRIQEFGSDGSFKGEFTFEDLHTELADFPEEGVVQALAVDPVAGAIYLAIVFNGNEPDPAAWNVYKIDPATGELLDTVTSPYMNRPMALAVDSDSNLYVIENGFGFKATILKFDAAGEQLLPDEDEVAEIEKGESFEYFSEPKDGTGMFGIATNGACGTESDDLYVTRGEAFSSLGYVKVYGPVPQDIIKCPPPPPDTPEIVSQYATSVGTEGAVLGAEINPHYALDATYYVQYGTAKCSEGGCTAEKPIAPGANLTKKVSDAPTPTAGVFLSDLEPGTTYHYRFVTQSSGGGPVVGGEKTFTTFPVPNAPLQACSNQAFRTGPSAKLVDCRAYEIVSPLDRSPAGDIVGLLHYLGAPAELNQSSVDGEKVTYTSEFAFGDAIGAPASTQYIATRKAGQGWSTHAVSPAPALERTNGNGNLKLELEDRAFTDDLCTSWLMRVFDPPLTADGMPGYVNLYKRQSCGAEGDKYESVSAAEAPLTVGPSFVELEGFSSDGSRSVFQANAKLTADAPDLGKDTYAAIRFQLYWEKEGMLRFICRLPNGSPLNGDCWAGSDGRGAGTPVGRYSSVSNAVSADASRVYWSAIGTVSAEGTGVIYLRENAGEEQSAVVAGKCTEEEKACTYPVSASGKNSRFWAAANDGSFALYGEEEGDEKLRVYDASSRSSTTIAQGVLGVAGAADDLSRFYFASRKAIGGKGEAGKPNLYMRDGGTTSLIGTLSEEDVDNAGFRLPATFPVHWQPTSRAARVSLDGRHLLFSSSASLTGYDNRDVDTGIRDAEVYLYDAGSVGPVCISCNPTGARPLGEKFQEGINGGRGVAALIPPLIRQLHAPRVLSEDGNRAFFESFEALVARDVNGKKDVYEWHRSPDEAGCEAIGADMYVESSGGCLSLISSGESPADSEFVDASADGRDVFIRTASSLVPDDPGLIDIYDARIGGGFPPKAPIPPSCEGEACQSPPTPPNDPTPASSSFQGAGNVVEKPAKKARKKKARKKAQKKQKHNRQRRTAR